MSFLTQSHQVFFLQLQVLSATLGTWRLKKVRSATCHLATCCHQRLREGRAGLGRSNVFDGRQKRVEKLDRPICSSRGGLTSQPRLGQVLYGEKNFWGVLVQDFLQVKCPSHPRLWRNNYTLYNCSILSYAILDISYVSDKNSPLSPKIRPKIQS